MRTECRQATRPGPIDIGILSAMMVMMLLFEAVPAMTTGRLAVRTAETEMTGYDPGELYEIPPELPDEISPDIDEIINEVFVEIPPVQIINTDGDETGLNTVNTVANPDILVVTDPADQGIPEPGTFIPHSQPPECTFRPVPEYPEMARMAGVEGRVTLQLFITTDGVPAEVIVIQSSGLPSMDDVAVEAAWDTRWTPAKRADGNPVGVWTSMIYDFLLD